MHLRRPHRTHVAARFALLYGFVGVLGCGPNSATPRSAVAPAQSRVSAESGRWRGFNLLGMFRKEGIETAFNEDDFKWIHELGFNFVRLPMDYRIWTDENDWHRLDEEKLKRIDQAVAWGEKYGLHVCLNLHRGPGYTVAHPPETKSLWTDAEAEEAFRLQWTTLALRYRGLPASALSFNLLNEPAGVDAATYGRIVRAVTHAIWEIDPKRPVIVDGLDFAEQPLPSLADVPVIQSTRGYAPRQLTHWNPKETDFPIPEWPMPNINRLIFGNQKPELKSALRIEGYFPNASKLTLHVLQVSIRAHLEIKANGASVWKKTFTPGPGQGEWKEVVFKPEWSIYQNIYDRDYEVDLPSGTKTIELSVEDGDWLSFSSIAIGSVRVSATTQDFHAKQGVVYLKIDGTVDTARTAIFDREWLASATAPWKAAENKGVRVFVGEFGAFDKAPHPVVLAWMDDELATWKKAGWGWAMWNFRGEFGILDSERADVVYESFHGHKLDRKMLSLLQRYLPQKPSFVR